MAASRLQTTVGNLTFANPILTASGTYGSGKEYAPFVNLSRLGGVVTKSVTLYPTLGNPPPRVVETPAGMLNAIGLQNEGVEVFLKTLLPPLRKKAKRVIVNVAGKTVEEYVGVVERLEGSGIDALEINISCPNVKEGGMAFGVSASAAAGLIRRLRPVTTLPLWVKLSPNVTDIVAIARAVYEEGADALTVANTFLGMAIDIETRRPILGNITGGLSGPAIHPLTLRLVWEVAHRLPCPIVAAGGGAGVREIVAFLLAGASAVEIGTMNFVEPAFCERLIEELEIWCSQRNTTVRELIKGLIIPESDSTLPSASSTSKARLEGNAR